MKKILLLGDSIRLGYCEFVKEILTGQAEVFYPADNGRFLQYTLRQLQDWKTQLNLSSNDIDVIHWNNGLWDCGHLGMGGLTGEDLASTAKVSPDGTCVYEEEPLTPPDFYAYLLRRVYQRLRALFPQARVIFALTSSILEEQAPNFLYRTNAEIREYNKIAQDVLSGFGVEFNDLNTFTAGPEIARLHRDWVHFNDAGSRLIAEEIAGFLKPYLA